jgi:hypothetical protein
MSDELTIYKQNKIDHAKNAYNNSSKQLYYYLVINIKNIQNSRTSIRNKQIQINNLVTQYNNNINTLKNTLNKYITNINNFVPNQIIINQSKKGLLIGINYTGTQNELYGCISDVNSINERISKQGFNNINIMTDLTTKLANRDNILTEFKNLLINSKPGDLLFFLYSGHGSYVIDDNGDEKTGYDQVIVPCDFKIIIDDELKSIIQTYLKKDVTLVAIFDSCFSGSVLDLKYQYMDSLNYDKFTENDKQLDTQGNVIMISGCTDFQTSSDSVFNNKRNGALTWSLLESLKQNPNYSWRELIKNMRRLLKENDYSQIPQLSCGSFVDIDKKIFI